MKPDELRELVATMRELGVTECGDVKLGPAPAAKKEPQSVEQSVKAMQERKLRAEEHQRDVMFAASHVKPALVTPK